MCDTLGIIEIKGNRAFFAKNSDRSPNEPQILEYIPAKENNNKKLKVTYMEIEQVEQTNAIFISRPIWMWGAEMGVNEKGVCIGNEAVFTKGKYGKNGLTGMDLVRLGLERGDTAKQAVDIIIDLLEKYGQGGNCGYDHKFFYDNAFMVMDKKEIFVLETKNKKWAVKKYDRVNISNKLNITQSDNSSEKGNFKLKYTERFFTFGSGATKRQNSIRDKITNVNCVEDLFKILRMHNKQGALNCGSVTSPCMHAGGIVGDHTTSSLVIELSEKINIWVTGCSTPCISIFKPITEQENLEFINNLDYWYNHEKIHRRFIGKVLPQEFYKERDQIEKEWIDNIKNGEKVNYGKEKEFYSKWCNTKLKDIKIQRRVIKYWKNKNKVLDKKIEEFKQKERKIW